jgi:DNA-binding CsgD family transcriptional regulator
LLTEAQARWEELADPSGTAYVLVHLGITALFAGDAVGAERLLTEAEARYRALGDARNTAQTGVWLGYLAGARGNMAQAAGHLTFGIKLSMQAHDPRLLYHCATLVIWLSAGRGSAELLIRLVGAQEALRTRTGFMPSAWIQAQLATATATARSRLAPEAFEAQRIEGQALSFPQMAELALRVLETGAQAAAESDKTRGKNRSHRILSEREEEVMRLVAQGLSNKAIAHQLIIAPSTVSYYITSTFNKLGVNTRAQAVAEATRRNLL